SYGNIVGLFEFEFVSSGNGLRKPCRHLVAEARSSGWADIRTDTASSLPKRLVRTADGRMSVRFPGLFRRHSPGAESPGFRSFCPIRRTRESVCFRMHFLFSVRYELPAKSEGTPPPGNRFVGR